MSDRNDNADDNDGEDETPDQNLEDARRDPCLQSILAKYPAYKDGTYLKEYKKRLKDKFSSLNNDNELGELMINSIIDGIKKRKSNFRRNNPGAKIPKNNLFLDDIFQTYQTQSQDYNAYQEDALKTLKYFYYYLSEDTLKEIFERNRRSFLKSGLEISDRMDADEDTEEVKFDGEPVEDVEQPDEELDTTTLHDQLQKELDMSKDPDLLSSLSKLMNKQILDLSLPPPPPLYDPRRKREEMNAEGAKFKCTFCDRDEFVELCVMCNNKDRNKTNAKGTASCNYCEDCFRQQVYSAYPVLREEPRPIDNPTVKLSDLREKEITDIDCRTNGHKINASAVAMFLGPKDIARARGIPLASQFPSTTVYAGLCAKCYFPLFPTWKYDGEWVCSNGDCECVYYIDL